MSDESAGTSPGSSHPSWSGPLVDPTGRTVLHEDTRVMPDTRSVRGTVAATSFTGPEGLRRRWRLRLERGQVQGAAGPHVVELDVRATGQAEIELRWGLEEGDELPNRGERLSVPGDAEGYASLAAGTVSLPEAGVLIVEGWASGSDALYWDRISLEAVEQEERGVVPSIPVVPPRVEPSAAAQTGAGGTSTLDAMAVPAPRTELPVPKPRVPLPLVAGIVAALVIIGAIAGIVLTGGEEPLPPSPSPTAEPIIGTASDEPLPEEGAFAGAYDVVVEITKMSGDVGRLRQDLGRSKHQAWLLNSRCSAPGECELRLVGLSYYEAGIKATTAHSGSISGSGALTFRCIEEETNRDLGPVPATFRYTVTIEDTEAFGSGQRVTSFTGEVVYILKGGSGCNPSSITEALTGTSLAA